MVVILMWINSWAVLVISLAMLLVAVVVLVCCTCWRSKKKNSNQFYVMDENGFRDTRKGERVASEGTAQHGFFRKFSLTSGSFTTTTSILKSAKPSNKYMSTKVRRDSENELLDSLDLPNEFDEAVLQIDALTPKLPSVEEDRISCFSNDSKFTFYSTYPHPRASSVAETMKSALSRRDSDFSCQ